MSLQVPFLLLLSTCLALVSCRGLPDANPRDPRFFWNPYTRTQVVPKLVTSLIPSSCIQVEPSLPPCRNVRNLEEFPRFLGGYQRQEEVNHEVIPSVHSTTLGWGEYLGIYAPTVTVTAMELRTTTVLDPRTVVTFSVKGCKPSKLPMDLHLCPSGDGGVQPTATYQSALTTTTLAHQSPLSGTVDLTAVDHNAAAEVHNNNLEYGGQVEASQAIEQHVPPAHNVQTQPLTL